MPERKKIFTVKKGGVVFEVLKKSGINPETVLVFMNKKPIPDDFRVKKGDRLMILEITSSG